MAVFSLYVCFCGCFNIMQWESYRNSPKLVQYLLLLCPQLYWYVYIPTKLVIPSLYINKAFAGHIIAICPFFPHEKHLTSLPPHDRILSLEMFPSDLPLVSTAVLLVHYLAICPSCPHSNTSSAHLPSSNPMSLASFYSAHSPLAANDPQPVDQLQQ